MTQFQKLLLSVNLGRIFALLFLAILGISTVFNFYFRNKVLNGVTIANIDVSRKTVPEVITTLNQAVTTPQILILTNDGVAHELDLDGIGFNYNFEKSAQAAFEQYRTKSFATSFFLGYGSLYRKKILPLAYELTESKLDEYLGVLSAKIDVEEKPLNISLKDGELVVYPGQQGKVVNQASLKIEIRNHLANANVGPITIPVIITGKTVSPEEQEQLKSRAGKLLGKTLTIEGRGVSYVVDDITLLELVTPKGFGTSKVTDLVTGVINPKFSSEPQNAIFKVENGRAIEFVAAKAGSILDTTDLIEKVQIALLELETSSEKSIAIQVVTQEVRPDVTTEEVNDLGINELLGVGTSKFKGSISGRVHNVNLASSRLNGTLISPGTTVSFNQILGDVSAFTGYKQAYIIKDGRTILGDGGGVCQTSTTLFRAVLAAGLPIVERRAHAYRVGYYEQDSPPGLDATVFSPYTDFKFKNDTPNHLLIQTKTDLENLALTYEIYGTNDGRVATTTKPITTSQVAPPEDLYVDDPTIPAGRINQIEHKAWGAKVSFDYTVKRGSETIFEKTFVSNYRPWQAVYLRGVGQ